MDRNLSGWGVGTGSGLLVALLLLNRRAFHEPSPWGLDVQLLFWGGPLLLAAVCGCTAPAAPWRWAIPIASGVVLADVVSIVQDALKKGAGCCPTLSSHEWDTGSTLSGGSPGGADEVIECEVIDLRPPRFPARYRDPSEPGWAPVVVAWTWRDPVDPVPAVVTWALREPGPGHTQARLVFAREDRAAIGPEADAAARFWDGCLARLGKCLHEETWR